MYLRRSEKRRQSLKSKLYWSVYTWYYKAGKTKIKRFFELAIDFIVCSIAFIMLLILPAILHMFA